MTAESATPSPVCPRCNGEIPSDATDGLCPRCLFDLATGDDSDSLTGKTISHYEVLDQLSMGGMGVVYKARDSRLGRFVAIKFMRDEIADDPDAAGRFKREALAVATLHHPNICPFFDFGDHEGRPFLVTELLEGETLDERMARGPLSFENILDYATQIAEGLKAAHAKGFVHRDIKPSNLFLTSDGEVKLLDFGLAKPLRWDPSMGASVPTLTASAVVAGTIPYMSPEQLQAKSVDPRTDFFSLGVVLYEMAARHRPFGRDSAAETIAAIQREDPEPLHQINHDIPRPMSNVITKLLSKDPTGRHSDARELLAELEEIRKPETIGNTSRRFIPVAVVMLIMAAVLLSLIVAVPPIMTLWSPEPERVVESIAVLPFENLSGNPEHDQLTILIANEVRRQLAEAKIEDLRVLPRTMTTIYGSGPTPPEEVIDDLDVDAVLEGTIQVLNDALHLVIEMSDESQIFLARRYEQPLDDVYESIQEIARDVANEIRTSLSPEAQARLSENDVVPFEALINYSRGQSALDRRTPGAFPTAINFFTLAIEQHRMYADAYAGRAHVNVVLGTTGYSNLPSSELSALMEDARSDVEQALLLDPDLAEAHAVNAMLLMAYDWKWDEARDEFLKAIDLDPDYAEARHWYALYLASQRDLDGALREVQMAQSLDPGSPLIAAALGRIYYYRNEFDEAAASYRSALSIEPNSVPARLGLLIFYLQQRRLDEAAVEIGRSITMPAEQGAGLIFQAILPIINGQYDEAEEIVAGLAEAEGREISALYFAIFWAVAGNFYTLDPDRVLTWLERAADERSDYMNYINVDPLFEEYRGEPRFIDLLDRVGLGP